MRVPEVEAAAVAPTRVEERKTPRVTKGKKKKASARTNETAIWDGLIAAPSRPETRLRDSLLYPLWGATGVALLVIFPGLLWVTSLPLVSTLLTIRTTQSVVAASSLFFLLIPAAIVFTGVLGYVLLYLGRVAASSALGEVHHPRWPDWEVSGVLFGLGRWAWAGLVGFAAGGFPATAYWLYCGDVDLFDAMILGELVALGAVYALLALLASILHEDALAANPFTVLAAVWRSGWGYAQPCLLAGAAVVVVVTLGAATFEVSHPLLGAFLFWAFWFVALYEAMVVLRVLGLFYHKHARELGWFRGRTGWGV